jgi:antitoxin ParD1/3/4
MDQMNISVTDELAAFVRARVKSGRYNNASEVVREALRRMERDDERAERLAEPTLVDILTNLTALQAEGIRKRVLEGIAEIEQGQFTEFAERAGLSDLAARVKARGRRRLQELRS